MGNILRNAFALSSFAFTASASFADPGRVTDYSNGQPTRVTEAIPANYLPPMAGGRSGGQSPLSGPSGGYRRGGPTKGKDWQSNGWYVKNEGRGTIWYKPICSVPWRHASGSTETYNMEMDVFESSPPTNAQLYCYVAQEQQFVSFCNSLKSDPQAHRNFEDIMRSSYMMANDVTIVPSHAWTVARNAFRLPDGVTEETIYQDYMKGHSFPQQGNDLFNARFGGSRRLEARVGPNSHPTGPGAKSGACSIKLPNGKMHNCECATARNMLRVVALLANSASVRNALNPNAKVKEVVPQYANRYFGSSPADKIKPVLGYPDEAVDH